MTLEKVNEDVFKIESLASIKVKPKVLIASFGGSGKTDGALQVAKGLAGEKGKRRQPETFSPASVSCC